MRNTQININVNEKSAVTSIKRLKEAFVELNKQKEKVAPNGKLKLEIDTGKADFATINSLAKAINKLTGSMAKYQANTDQMVKSGQMFNVTTNNIVNNVNKTTDATKNMNTELIASAMAFSLVRKSFTTLMRDYNSLTSSTFSVGVASQMNISQINALNDSFLQLSRTVPSSAKEMSDAVDALIRTGRSYEDSRKIIQETAKLASASGDSLKSTAEVVTKVMVSLGVSGDKVGETLTTMHSTAIQTASNMGYLAEAFKNVAGTASVMVKQSGLAGKELDDYRQRVLDFTMASIGSMANLGLSASQAGTKVKNLFGKMTAGEKSARMLFDTAMKLNNITAVDGKMFNFDSLSKMTKEDLPLAVQKMSELYMQGVLGTQVMQKMFTARHFMEISNLLIDINGDVQGFIDGIAKGISYTNDFYKSMFDINNQMKQFGNHFKASFGSMGQIISESSTGMLMLANDGMSKIAGKGGQVISTVATIASVMGTATLSTVALGRAFEYIKPMFMAGGGWIGVAIGLFTVLAGAIGKLHYEQQRAIADLNMSLNSNALAGAKLRKELDAVRAKYQTVNDVIRESSAGNLINDIDQASTLMTAMLNKSKDFADMIESLGNVRKIDETMQPKIDLEQYDVLKKSALDKLTSIQTIQSNMLRNETDYLNRMREGAMSEEKGYEQSNANISKLYDTRITTHAKFLKEYIALANTENDIKKRTEKAFELGEKHGLSGFDVKNILARTDLKELDQRARELGDVYEEIKKYNEELNNSFKDVQKQILDNNIAFNKAVAHANKTTLEVFEATGEIEIGGNTYKGLEGLFEVFKEAKNEDYEASIRNINAQIELYKKSIEGLEEQQKLGAGAFTKKEADNLEKSRLTMKGLVEFRDNILQAQSKSVGFSKEDMINQFKGYKFTNKTKDIMFDIMVLKNKIKDMRLVNDKDEAYIDTLERDLKNMFILLDVESKKEEARTANKSTYQIKYANFLKESLDLELQRLKISESVGKQEYLNYQYKLKQLNANKDLAKKEVEVARTTLMKLGAKEFANISTTTQGQDILDRMYEQNKGTLVGDAGKRKKDTYDALKQLVGDLSKLEKINMEIDLAPLEKYMELLSSLPNLQKDTISNLQEMSFMNIIPQGGYSEQTISIMRKNLETSLNKVYNSYKIPSTMGIADAINEELSHITYLDSIVGNSEAIAQEMAKAQAVFGDSVQFTNNEQENYVTLLTLSHGKLNDLTTEQKAFLELKKKELDYQNKILKTYEKVGSMMSKLGSSIQSETLQDLGSVFSSFGAMMTTANSSKFSFKDLFNFELSDSDFSDNLGKALENAIAGIDMGSAVGSLVGGITGGGQASQTAGTIAGLGTAMAGITGWEAMAIQAGASLVGGLFGSKDRSAEAERYNKEQKKIYDKNTDALNRLAQNMASLSGGVDGLNNSLISAFSKIPTFNKLTRVTDGLNDMYKDMVKTREFSNVAYQVTKTKKSKGFLGMGGGSTSWTETIELSVEEMLRKYGYDGTINDMSTDELRAFSTWLENFNMGDTDNFGVLANAIEDYAEATDKMDKKMQNFFRDATMEGFSGISSIAQEEVAKQITDFYKSLGFQIDDAMSAEIDKIAEKMSVMVTVTQDVRGAFVKSWRNTGLDSGKAFLGAMNPYIDAMLDNISQVFYDVYFSDVNDVLEESFKNLSEELVELKKQGATLEWDSVAGSLEKSFDSVITTIKQAQAETTSFNEILLQLQNQAFDAGLTLSEMLELGLVTGTQKDVLTTFKESLLGDGSALISIGDMVGEKIGNAVADKLMDNMMSDKVLEFSAQLDKVLSGNMSFDAMAELSNQALSVGLMMETERQRLEAIKSMFSMGEISYETQNQNITYETGHSSQNTYIYNVSSTVQAGNVIESDDIETLAREILEEQLEILRIDKGIDLKK